MRNSCKMFLYAAISTSSTSAFAQATPPVNSGTTDIVVTAQRRAERLLDVPASVSAVSKQSLENQVIRSVIDLGQTVPGLVMDKNGGGTQAAIRGVTTQVTGAGSDANIAIYLDGVYQPLVQANNFRFPDLERVEVLKGPQGSLYGRNATGGAILFVTKDPQFTTAAKVTAEYGSFNSALLTGFVTGPLSDNVAISVSGSYSRSDGYVVDLIRGGKANPSEGVELRGKLLWRLSDNTKLLLTGFYTDLEDGTAFAAVALNGNTIGRALGAKYSTQPWQTAVDTVGSTPNRQYGGVGKLTSELGFATLTLTSAYTRYKLPYSADIDNSSSPVVAILGPVQNFRNMQDEVVLASNRTSGVKWMVGFNYYDMNQLTIQDAIISAGDAGTYRRLLTRAYAGFVDISVPISERLLAFLGYRYTRETATLYSRLGLNVSSLEPFPFIGRKTWSSGTPKATLQYKLSEYTNVYATYSRGFKSGVFNPNGLTTVDPENLNAYEVGFKTQKIRGLMLSLAGFYYDYSNQQVSTSITVNGAPQGTVQNAGKSRLYGLDGELTAQISNSFSVHSGLSLLNTKFTNFANAVVLVPSGSGGNVQVVLPNARGKESLRSPSWTLSLTANYSREFSFGKLQASATLFHSDKYYVEYGNRVAQPPYTTLDGRVSLTLPDGRWNIYVYGRNLTDSKRITSALITGLGDSVVYAPPRSVGVGVGIQF